MTAYQKNFTASLAPSGLNERYVPLLFRVLGATADSGTDFLGDTYRAAVVQHSSLNINPAAAPTSYWLSQPNPSAFAVESLYFDIRSGQSPSVIDSVTLDPITPGVNFTIYYSTDASPGTDIASWEKLLWTPVYQQYQANRQDTYVLPRPITASYVKVEFTNLQARTYTPGEFQVPTSYKKHPKWVLDYFLARFAAQDLDLVSSGVDITYDALDLAFSYYKADILHAPDPPALSQPITTQNLAFFQQENAADTIDPFTLAQIRIAFQPFLNQPAQLGRVQSILGQYAMRTASANYSTEVIQTTIADTSIVSNLLREPLLLEKGFPVMSFYVPCRHTYRVAQAYFAQNVGYFAGVNTIAFHRDVYTTPADQDQYNEPLGDTTNVLINDFT